MRRIMTRMIKTLWLQVHFNLKHFKRHPLHTVSHSIGSGIGPPSNVVEEILQSSEKMINKRATEHLPLIFNHMMRGTQTPLTLIGVTMPKYNEDEQKIEPKSQDAGKTEISVALDQSSLSGARDVVMQGPSTSLRSSFRVEAVDTNEDNLFLDM